MTIRKRIRKLLPGFDRELTGSGTELDKSSYKPQSTSKFSLSFSSTSSPLVPPSPPSYEEVTLGNDRADVFLSTEKNKNFLFVYYVLMQFWLDHESHFPLYHKLPLHRAENPTAAGSATINAAGNYAFLLALLYTSKQYNIPGWYLAYQTPDVGGAIFRNVKEEMVKCFQQEPKQYNRIKKWRLAREAHRVVNTTCEYFALTDSLGVLDYACYNKERGSIDFGELDGRKVQQYWGLFKTMLVQRTSSGTLLPPRGFRYYGGQSQRAMQRVWR